MTNYAVEYVEVEKAPCLEEVKECDEKGVQCQIKEFTKPEIL